MLRILIAWVLNTFLGKFVENLNKAQVTIALLSGRMELKNISLSKDALRHFGLPLQIVSGSIGRLKLTIPIFKMFRAPWYLHIDDVEITCGPIDLAQDWNTEVEQQTELDLKVASLDRLETKWRAERETPVTEGSYYASSYSGWLNYGTSLVTNIIENLQLTVNGIHVRYEDGLTVPNQHFGCGIKIDSLSAQSCDASWTPGKTANWSTQHLTFKLVELTNFSVYWDPQEQPEPIQMINPISVRGQLRWDRSETPLRTRSRPRLIFYLIWEEIKIALSDIQYNQMMQCVRGLDDIARFRRFKLQRPITPVCESARDWWRYAVRCHGLCRHLGTDPYVIAKENLQYIRIYMRIVANPNEVLSSANKQFKDRIERDRTFDELRLLRVVCMKQMPKLEKTNVSSPSTATAGKSMLVHYFPQWWYSNKNNNNNNSTEGSEQQRTPPGTGHDDISGAIQNFPGHGSSDETGGQQLALMGNSDGSSYWGNDGDLSPVSSFEDEILDALAGSVESNSLLKRDAVFGKFNFILKRGTLDFCSSLEMAPKLQFMFQDLKMDVESRPRSGSHYVGLSLGSILIKDRLTSDSQFRDLLKPLQKPTSTTPLDGRSSKLLSTTSLPADISASEPNLELQYERKPLSCGAVYSFKVSRAFEIEFTMDTVRWLQNFLAKPHQQYDALRKLEDLKNSASSADSASNSNADCFFGAQRDVSGDIQMENEEDDAFMNPCSTAPGSEASTPNPPTLVDAFSFVPELVSDRALTFYSTTLLLIIHVFMLFVFLINEAKRSRLQESDLRISTESNLIVGLVIYSLLVIIASYFYDKFIFKYFPCIKLVFQSALSELLNMLFVDYYPIPASVQTSISICPVCKGWPNRPTLSQSAITSDSSECLDHSPIIGEATETESCELKNSM